MRPRGRRTGSSTLEFALVGVPVIFILISVANMSFAMLTLHTMQEAVEQGGRYVATRGSGCASPNACTTTVGAVCTVVANAAPGIDRNALTISLVTNGGTATTCSYSSSTQWPPTSENAPGNDITIKADYTIPFPVAMFWPGTGTSSNKFASSTFHANSQQRLMF